MEEEIWKASSSYPAYSASSFGRVMVNPYAAKMPYGGERIYGGTPTLGAWSKPDKRYVVVRKGKTTKVARIVCDAFYGPAPTGAVCMHLDENSKNNRPENLAWGTQKENLNAPSYKAGGWSRPRKLSKEDTEAIKSSSGRTCDLASRYGVKPCTISNIRAAR